MCHLHDHAATLLLPPLSLFISEAGEMKEKKAAQTQPERQNFPLQKQLLSFTDADGG